MSAPTSFKLDPRWIINKGIRTSDGYVHSSIVATTEDSIIVIEGVVRRHKYVIPKSIVRDFDGSYLHLTIPESELVKYEEKH